MRPPRGVRPIAIARLGFLVLFAAAVLYVSFFAQWRPDNVEEAKRDLQLTGVYAPLLAGFLQAVGLVFFIPGFLLILATALVFGLKSIWISIFGQTLGAIFCLYIARMLGRDFFRSLFGSRILALERLLSEHGFRTLVLLRFLSLIPLPLLAYAPGLVNLRARDAILAAMIGEMPFIVVVGLFGHTLAGIHQPTDMLTGAFLLPAALLLSLWTIPAVVLLVLNRRRRRAQATTSDATAADAFLPPPRP